MIRAFASRGGALLLGMMLAVPGVGHAADNVTVSADASANAGYSNNPYSEAGSGTGSGYVQARISPAVKLTNETSIFTLLGIFSDKQFFQHYSNVYDVAGQLLYAGTPSAHLNTHADVKYDNSIVGQNNYSGNVIDSSTTSAPVTSGTDIGLFGTRTRRQTGQVDGGFVYQLSQHDTITMSGYYLLSRYGQSVAANNYDAFGGNIGYSRRIAEHAQIGLQTGYAHYTYQSVRGHTNVLSPQGTFSAQLGPAWKVDGALGVSFINNSISGTSTALTGNFDLCRISTRSDLCVTAQRASVPTGSGQIQNELLLGARYSYKVTEFSTITANANYTDNAGIQSNITGQNRYLRGAVGYDRKISQRVHVTIDARYAQIFGSAAHRDADFGGQLGIVAKLGRSE